MRNDALVKMELLDQKHGIVTSEMCLCVLFLQNLIFLYFICYAE